MDIYPLNSDLTQAEIDRLREIDRRLGGRLVLTEKTDGSWEAFLHTTSSPPDVTGATAIEAAERLLDVALRSPWLGTVAA